VGAQHRRLARAAPSHPDHGRRRGGGGGGQLARLADVAIDRRCEGCRRVLRGAAGVDGDHRARRRPGPGRRPDPARPGVPLDGGAAPRVGGEVPPGGAALPAESRGAARPPLRGDGALPARPLPGGPPALPGPDGGRHRGPRGEGARGHGVHAGVAQRPRRRGRPVPRARRRAERRLPGPRAVLSGAALRPPRRSGPRQGAAPRRDRAHRAPDRGRPARGVDPEPARAGGGAAPGDRPARPADRRVRSRSRGGRRRRGRARPRGRRSQPARLAAADLRRQLEEALRKQGRR
jgi:hypothetical protein